MTYPRDRWAFRTCNSKIGQAIREDSLIPQDQGVHRSVYTMSVLDICASNGCSHAADNTAWKLRVDPLRQEWLDCLCDRESSGSPKCCQPQDSCGTHCGFRGRPQRSTCAKRHCYRNRRQGGHCGPRHSPDPEATTTPAI